MKHFLATLASIVSAFAAVMLMIAFVASIATPHFIWIRTLIIGLLLLVCGAVAVWMFILALALAVSDAPSGKAKAKTKQHQ